MAVAKNSMSAQGLFAKKFYQEIKLTSFNEDIKDDEKKPDINKKKEQGYEYDVLSCKIICKLNDGISNGMQWAKYKKIDDMIMKGNNIINRSHLSNTVISKYTADGEIMSQVRIFDESDLNAIHQCGPKEDYFMDGYRLDVKPYRDHNGNTKGGLLWVFIYKEAGALGSMGRNYFFKEVIDPNQVHFIACVVQVGRFMPKKDNEYGISLIVSKK